MGTQPEGKGGTERTLSRKIREVCAEVTKLYPELAGLCAELLTTVRALELEAGGLSPEDVLETLRGLAL